MWCSRGCLEPHAISDAWLCHVSIAGGSRRRGCAAAGVSGFLDGPLAPELVRAAVGRRLVVAPAQDLGAVADAVVGGVVERHLDHELRAQLDPLELALVVPATRVAVAALPGLVRRELGRQLALLLDVEAGRVADRAQLAVGLVKAEDQRADRALLLARAPAHDHGVDRAHALDLAHAHALARAIRRVGALG